MRELAQRSARVALLAKRMADKLANAFGGNAAPVAEAVWGEF